MSTLGSTESLTEVAQPPTADDSRDDGGAHHTNPHLDDGAVGGDVEMGASIKNISRTEAKSEYDDSYISCMPVIDALFQNAYQLADILYLQDRSVTASNNDSEPNKHLSPPARKDQGMLSSAGPESPVDVPQPPVVNYSGSDE
jgi:hypothetical protein